MKKIFVFLGVLSTVFVLGQDCQASSFKAILGTFIVGSGGWLNGKGAEKDWYDYDNWYGYNGERGYIEKNSPLATGWIVIEN